MKIEKQTQNGKFLILTYTFEAMDVGLPIIQKTCSKVFDREAKELAVQGIIPTKELEHC